MLIFIPIVYLITPKTVLQMFPSSVLLLLMLNKYFYITLFTISLIIGVYFVRSTIMLYSAKHRLYEAEEKLQDLKNQSLHLKEEIDYRKSDTYVINEAREKLNYGFEGEEIIIVPRELTNEAVLEGDLNKTPTPTPIYKSVKTDETRQSILKMWFETFF